MLEKIRIAFVIISIGICAGLGAHYILDKETGILVDRPLSVVIPKDGIKTDTFGIRLLQATLEKAPESSCLVCPHLVSEALLILRELANPPIRQDIEKLGIRDNRTGHTSSPDISITVAADYSLPFTEGQQQEYLMRLPFRSNLPVAMSLINGALGQNDIGTQRVVVGSDFLNRDTKFIACLYAAYTPKMQTPFLAGDSIVSEFENANGSLPKVCMMRLRADIRYAKDSNGAWEAVAILLKPDHRDNGEPTAFIAILPTQSAAKMAAELTSEQIGIIRKALAEAAPTDCCVELPQMKWSLPTRNLESTLRSLGLGKLFDITENNWSFADRKLGLDSMPEKIAITLTHEQKTKEQRVSVENAAYRICFNRPFIWLIGDLTTNTPAYYIGLVQNL